MKEHLPTANQYASHHVKMEGHALGQATVIVLMAGLELAVTELCVLLPVTMVGLALHQRHAPVLLAGQDPLVMKSLFPAPVSPHLVGYQLQENSSLSHVLSL